MAEGVAVLGRLVELVSGWPDHHGPAWVVETAAELARARVAVGQALGVLAVADRYVVLRHHAPPVRFAGW